MPDDPINPAHYQGDYVMRVIEDFKLNFCLGNVVKYILRSDNKGGVEDLNKAMWYLRREIARHEICDSQLSPGPNKPFIRCTLVKGHHQPHRAGMSEW